MNILTIIGSRPEAIKVAPILKQLESEPDINSFLCTTGQHRQMLDQVLDMFELEPNVDLSVMQKNQSLSQLSVRILERIEPVLDRFDPDWVLVQGDTTSAMIGALTAFYRKIKIGHVEAGLRSYDKYQPFPEEINRKIVSTVTDLNFAPTEKSKANLITEGYDPEKIIITGNTVVDATHLILKAKTSNNTQKVIDQLKAPLANGTIPDLILVTAHRRENFGQPILNICNALKKIANHYNDSIRIVYPVHLNPNIYKPVRTELNEVKNICLIEPVDYQTLVHLIKMSKLILTDSGGIQEEAPGFDTPVLVLRNVTERPEGVDAGAAKIVGTDVDNIVTSAHELLSNKKSYELMSNAPNPYGDGTAAQKIVNALKDYS